MSIFQPASKAKLPVKMGLVGPAGSGKTLTALKLARGMVGPEGRIALVDTEHGSAREYADITPFFHAEMTGTYEPSKFVRSIREAEKDGFDIVILDGISPAWNGPGGVQEIVDKNSKGGNSWAGWAVGTPEHQKLLEAILACKIHLIASMRSKTAWALEENEKGKKVPVKIGMEPVQRDGIDYEFTIVGHLDLAHQMTIYKSRRRSIPVGEVISLPDEETGRKIIESAELLPEIAVLDPRLTSGLSELLQPEPEATPEPPAPEPVAEVTAPSEGLLDVPTPEPAQKAEDGLTLEQIEHLDKLATELKELRPDLDWLKKIDDAAERDYGKKAIELSPENGKALIEKLTNTRNQVRDQQQAGAPA